MIFRKKFTLDDFFNDTFKQLGPIIVRTYIPLIILLLPFSIIYGIGMLKFFTGYFNFIIGIIDGSVYPDFSAMGIFGEIMPYYGRLISISLVLGITSTFTLIVVIENMAQRMLPEREPKDLRTLAIRSLPRVILAGIIQVLLIIGAELAVILVVALFAFLSGLFLKALWIFLMVVIIIAFFAAMIWFMVSFSLSSYLIVIEDEGAWASLKKSFILIRKNWWRYALISLLFSIFVSFALSLVTTPFLIFSILPSFSDLFNSMGSAMDEYEIFLSITQAFQKTSIGWIIGIVTFIQLFVEIIFMTIFHSLFYMDLKVRKGEISSGEETTIQ